MALADRKKRQVESLNDVKKISEEITRARLNNEFGPETRAKYSNIAAEGVTDGTPVSEAAEKNPAEPGQVNVEAEERGANIAAGRDEDAGRPKAVKK